MKSLILLIFNQAENRVIRRNRIQERHDNINICEYEKIAIQFASQRKMKFDTDGQGNKMIKSLIPFSAFFVIGCFVYHKSCFPIIYP